MPRTIYSGGQPGLTVLEAPEGPFGAAGVRVQGSTDGDRLDRADVTDLVEGLEAWLEINGGRR